MRSSKQPPNYQLAVEAHVADRLTFLEIFMGNLFFRGAIFAIHRSQWQKLPILTLE